MDVVDADSAGTRPRGASRRDADARRVAVENTLREEILEGRIGDAERLNERELAERFGVSRVPVREALLVLAGEGMVELRPRQGASVIPLGRRSVRDLFELRAVLEPMAARWCALRAQPQQLQELHDLVERARLAGVRHDLAVGSNANTDFHEMLFRAAGNEMLDRMRPSLVGFTRRVFRLSIQDHERMMWSDHRQILRAIEEGDADRAAALAAEHLENTRRHTFDLIDEREDALLASSGHAEPAGEDDPAMTTLR